MAGNVRCTRCSKTLPRGGGFCRRCGWPTTDAVPVAGDTLAPLTPPGFYPPLPAKEEPRRRSAWVAWLRRSSEYPSPAPARAAVGLVLMALVAAGFAWRASYHRTRAARAAEAAAAADRSNVRGTWRVIQSQHGRAVRDYLVPDVKQLGAGLGRGAPLPDDALRALRAAGRPSHRGVECVVTNHSGWTVHEVCVEARTWQDDHTTTTVVYRVPADIAPGRSGPLKQAIPVGGPRDRTEFKVVSALGEWTRPAPRRRR